MDKIANTASAHQQYSNPLVGIVHLLDNPRGRIAVFKDADRMWHLPRGFARGDEYLPEALDRTLRTYATSNSCSKPSSVTLLSGPDARSDAYQFNFVTRASFSEARLATALPMRWVSVDILDTLDLSESDRNILAHFFAHGTVRDSIVVPHNASERPESQPRRLARTKAIHADHFPMPLITVDGLLLKLGLDGHLEGIILERRSAEVDREPGKWALPAGFVQGHEFMTEALSFEVYEEIGLNLQSNQFLGGHGIGTGPHRDPQWFVWTQFLVAFTTQEPRKPELSGSGSVPEIDEVRTFPLAKLPCKDEMAFDHLCVIDDFKRSTDHFVKLASHRLKTHGPSSEASYL